MSEWSSSIIEAQSIQYHPQTVHVKLRECHC